MNQSPVVALIGCGQWGPNILRDLKALGATVAVVARSPASQERARLGEADLIVDAVDALPEVASVYIATPIGTHADVIDAVLDRGVPVFCEKPLSDDVGRAEDLARRAPDRLFVLDKWRYHPGVLEIARVARSGELGPVIGVATQRIGWGSSHPDASALWVLAPHDLAIGLEILGHLPDVRSAVLDGIGRDLSGAMALLAGGGLWLSLEVSERSPRRLRTVRLFCRDGSAMLADPFDDHISISPITIGDHSRALSIERRPIPTDWPLKTMLADTLRFLDGGPPPRTDAADAATIVRRVAAIAAAAATAAS